MGKQLEEQRLDPSSDLADSPDAQAGLSPALCLRGEPQALAKLLALQRLLQESLAVTQAFRSSFRYSLWDVKDKEVSLTDAGRITQCKAVLPLHAHIQANSFISILVSKTTAYMHLYWLVCPCWPSNCGIHRLKHSRNMAFGLATSGS